MRKSRSGITRSGVAGRGRAVVFAGPPAPEMIERGFLSHLAVLERERSTYLARTQTWTRRRSRWRGAPGRLHRRRRRCSDRVMYDRFPGVPPAGELGRTWGQALACVSHHVADPGPGRPGHPRRTWPAPCRASCFPRSKPASTTDRPPLSPVQRPHRPSHRGGAASVGDGAERRATRLGSRLHRLRLRLHRRGRQAAARRPCGQQVGPAREGGRRTIRFHDLRHPHASLLLSRGTPVLDVSRRIGHTSEAMTLDVYGHVVPGQGNRAAAAFADLVEGGR
jgi:hypothetical protein